MINFKSKYIPFLLINCQEITKLSTVTAVLRDTIVYFKHKPCQAKLMLPPNTAIKGLEPFYTDNTRHVFHQVKQACREKMMLSFLSLD